MKKFETPNLMPKDQELLNHVRQVFQIQIESLQAVALRMNGSIAQLIDQLQQLEGKVIVTGVGKSGIIGQKIAATLASTGTSSVFMNASEALHGDLGIVTPGDAVIMISNSGSTLELARMMPSLRHHKVPVYGIFGNLSTALAKQCDVLIDASVEAEACHLGLAPTCSSTAALVIGDAIACALMKSRGFSSHDFAINHPGGALGRRLLLRVRDVMHTGNAIPTVPPNATLKDAAIELTRAPLGAVCICDLQRKLLGILTDGDLRRSLAKSDDLSVSVNECMTATPTHASPDDTLDHVIKIMETPGRQIYSLPVIDSERRLVGFVRMHDILMGDQ